ncbi:root hair defective 3 GTP-binding protein, partial [Rhizoctonia solani AG-3 Rhs1AP]
MYCLITMVYESGSTGQGGLVEKVIIDQESLGGLLNTLVPGSFRSISSIDFKSLDAITIKPTGVYGSRPEIAKFLLDQGTLDANIARMLSQPDHNAPSTNLRSGLYMVLSPKHGADKNSSHDTFLVYWPEEATWQDDAEPTVQRNRVTFMRYLTQLSDQIIALISKDQANAFVWESGSLGLDTSIEDEDEDDERMFAFEVQKSEDQEENVIASPGFKVDIPQDKFARKEIELVGGETSIGFLVSSLEPARVTSKENEGIQNGMSLKSLLSDKRHNIFLGHLNDAQLQLLLNTGLPERYPDRFAAYQADCTMVENERTQNLNADFHNIQSQMRKERPQIEQAVRDVWKAHSSKFESYVGTGKSSHDRKYSSNADRYACINSLGHEYTSKPLVHIPSNLFQDLKARITLIQAGLEAEERTREEQMELIQKILTEPLDDLEDLESSKKGWDPGTMSNESKDSAEIDDLNFLRRLDQVMEKYPALRDARQRTLDALREYLANTERSFVERETRKAIASITKLHGDPSKEAIDSKLNKKRSELWNKLWEDIRNAMALQPYAGKGPLIIRIDHIERVDRRGYRSKDLPDPAYRVRTTHTVLHSKKMQYYFYPLNLRKADIERLGEDAFVPQPQVRWDEAAFTFSLEEGFSLEFIQVMHDRCLVVVASAEKIFIYMNEFSQIGGAINLKHSKTTWHRTRLGSRPIYAYDEITRTFALCHGEEEPHLSWYVFDRRFSVLKASRTIPLIGWHTTSTIQSMCFVTGSTQLCVIDQSGFARILSLDSEQFGPAHVQLKPSFGNAFSAPDGSCLFVAIDDSETGKTELCAYHWASFGTRTEGFRPACLAPKSNYRVVSFDDRSGCYLVALSQSQPHIFFSVALHVKQKSAKFDFKAQGSRSKPHTQKTVNNCLIDAHMEVWLRFPVVSAITRNTLSGSSRQSRSIMLISEGEVERAISYFSKLIGTFERTTGKPTDGKLLSIAIQTSSKTSRFTQHGAQNSSFRFGGYLVELICLIPIQLAVTQENNFIPLKDGVLNAAFERELLGADVPTIISSLSLGWYESIFHSYQATKPVRVVSSMGEQSVGKSHCLNHLADTSFAGSAMRTTEGVWLSCTPTEDYLLVALDFEGVQSIERSAQEDTLLVLFNAAISNMSFQSSATVLDPDLNPGLFNSVLAIVIKDVIGSDTKDVVREFSDKLQAIVEEEQGRNFITRLHRSRINIIPWPVIKSRKFYTLFSGVRDTLEQQPVTYGGGALFLHTLKTLMAKIKANDWGALDQDLATHRARQLTQLLPGALSHGAMEIGPDSWGPLKVLDTDQEVQSYADDVFWVPNNQEITEPGPHSADQCLRVLIQKHSKYPTTRNEVPENQFLDSLQTLLNYQFERRVEQEIMIAEQIINALTLVLLTMGTPLLHVAVYHLDILDATYANPQSILVENRVHFGPAVVVSLLDRRSIISIPTNIYVLRGCIHADSLVIYRWSHQERQRLLGLFVLESARYPGIKNTSGMLVVTRSRVLLNAYYALGSAHPLTIFTDWIQTRYTSAVKSMLVQSSVRHQASARSKHSPPQLLSDLPEDTSNFSIHVTPRKNVAYHVRFPLHLES